MTEGLKLRASEPVGALAQRDELVRKRDESYAVYARETQMRQLAEGVMSSAAKRVRNMDFNGAAGEDELDAEVQHATAEADYRKHLDRANSALDRVKSHEAELDHLYEREFGVFAEEANGATEVADTAIADLGTAAKRAVEAWDAAVAAWAGPCRAARISGVPPFPVGGHVMAELLAGHVRAQPPSVEVMEPLGDSDLDDELTD
jgi:hypothetical protein